MNSTQNSQNQKTPKQSTASVDFFGEHPFSSQEVVASLPIEGLQYVEAFVNEAEEAVLLELVDAGPWRSDLTRRVQHFGWVYDYKKKIIDLSMHIGPLPGWLQSLAGRLAFEGFTPTVPDQVIVNEYLPGQGISSHVDCLGCFGPVVISLSLRSPCVMDLVSRKEQTKVSLPLARRSLLVLSGSARTMWSHAIASRKSDKFGGTSYRRDRRVSLTFRTVIFHR